MARKAGWFFLVFCIVIQAIVPDSLVAQEEEFPSGVDIVFVIDQSGSMMKGPIINQQTGQRGPPSDPDNLAIRSVRDGLAVIVSHIYKIEQERSLYDLTKQLYRFGLIAFGGDENVAASTRIIVDLTPIQVTADNAGNLTSNIDNLIPDSLDNMGETAFSYAFDTACTMLNCNSPPSKGRRRTVILLTDGAPSYDRFSYDWENPAPYFQRLQENHANLFQGENTSVWIIGLDKNNAFWPKNAPYWQRIAPGRTSQLVHPGEISGKFQDIAYQAIGTSPEPPKDCNQSFSVRPYLKTLSLSLDYPDTNSVAKFYLPDGTELQQGATVSRQRGVQSETYLITDPPSGEWKCTVISGYSAKFRNIEGKFEFVEVKIGSSSAEREKRDQPPSPCNDFTLGVTYYDNKGNVVNELPDYPLDQWIELTIDGAKHRRDLVKDPESEGSWMLKEGESFKPGSAGGDYPYYIEIKLRSDQTTIFTKTGNIRIDPRLPCIRIVKPHHGERVEMQKRLTPIDLEVAVELIQGGTPGTPVDVFQGDLSSIVKGNIQWKEGSKTFYLTPEGNTPGLFVAKISSSDLPQVEAKYTFVAEIDAKTLQGQSYRMHSESVSFSRVYSAFKKGYEWTLRGLFAAGILATLALIGFFIFLITGPYPKGSLLLEEKATGEVLRNGREWEEIRSIPISRMKLFGIFPTRWPSMNVNSAGLRKIKVRRLSRGNRDGVKVVLIRKGGGKQGSGAKTREELEFTRNGEQKRFDGGKYRLTYEDFSKGI